MNSLRVLRARRCVPCFAAGLVALATGSWATCAPAQHIQWIRQELPRLGGRPVVVGDLNTDGQRDLAIPVWIPSTGSISGHVEIRFASGADGSTLAHQLPLSPGDYIQYVYELGDTDGDGYPDFLASGVYQGIGGVNAISGTTFQWLYRLQNPPIIPFTAWGSSIAGGMDVDNDGFSDTVVGDAMIGVVYVYNHLGQEIYRRSSPNPGIRWQYVGPYGDYDQDGYDDFVVTAYSALTGLSGAEIVSGRTGLPLFRVSGVQPSDYLDQVTGCGDIDGDGRMDILLGGGNFAPGTVQAFSSATGQRVWAWYSGYVGDYFGQIMLGTVDIDQDGIVDPMATSFSNPVSAGSNEMGYLSIFSGRDGTEMLRFSDWSGTSSQTGFGYLLAVPPRPGSSLPRFLTTASTWTTIQSTGQLISRWYMFEAGPAGAATVGLGCTGTLPVEPRIGLRQIAPGQSRVTLSGADPGMLALLVLGTSATQPVQLSQFGFLGCTLYPSILEVGVTVPGSTGTNAGYAYHDFAGNFAASPGTLGMTIVGQFVVLGAGSHWPGGATAALRWHFL